MCARFAAVSSWIIVLAALCYGLASKGNNWAGLVLLLWISGSVVFFAAQVWVRCTSCKAFCHRNVYWAILPSLDFAMFSAEQGDAILGAFEQLARTRQCILSISPMSDQALLSNPLLVSLLKISGSHYRVYERTPQGLTVKVRFDLEKRRPYCYQCSMVPAAAAARVVDQTRARLLAEERRKTAAEEARRRAEEEERKAKWERRWAAAFYTAMDRIGPNAASHRSIDDLSGRDFEQLIATILKNQGWGHVRVVGGSGDHGADITGTDPQGVFWAIQTKQRGNGGTVPYSALQEVHTAQTLCNASKAAIVSTGRFSRQTENDARSLRVQLWRRDWIESGIWALRTSEPEDTCAACGCEVLVASGVWRCPDCGVVNGNEAKSEPVDTDDPGESKDERLDLADVDYSSERGADLVDIPDPQASQACTDGLLVKGSLDRPNKPDGPGNTGPAQPMAQAAIPAGREFGGPLKRAEQVELPEDCDPEDMGPRCRHGMLLTIPCVRCQKRL